VKERGREGERERGREKSCQQHGTGFVDAGRLEVRLVSEPEIAAEGLGGDAIEIGS